MVRLVKSSGKLLPAVFFYYLSKMVESVNIIPMLDGFFLPARRVFSTICVYKLMKYIEICASKKKKEKKKKEERRKNTLLAERLGAPKDAR